MRDGNVYLFSIQRLWGKVSPVAFNDSLILVVEGESIWAKRVWSSIHEIIDSITASTEGHFFSFWSSLKSQGNHLS